MKVTEINVAAASSYKNLFRSHNGWLSEGDKFQDALYTSCFSVDTFVGDINGRLPTNTYTRKLVFDAMEDDFSAIMLLSPNHHHRVLPGRTPYIERWMYGYQTGFGYRYILVDTDVKITEKYMALIKILEPYMEVEFDPYHEVWIKKRNELLLFLGQ